MYMYCYYMKIATLYDKKHDISDQSSLRLFHLKVWREMFHPPQRTDLFCM